MGNRIRLFFNDEHSKNVSPGVKLKSLFYVVLKTHYLLKLMRPITSQ